MYIIRKEFTFEAAHFLMQLPDSHPCSKVHGHSYKVVMEFRSTFLDETGFVKDYRALEPIKVWIDKVFDHSVLNDVLLINPTAENIAKYIFDVWSNVEGFESLYAVEVCETDKTMARYENA